MAITWTRPRGASSPSLPLVPIGHKQVPLIQAITQQVGVVQGLGLQPTTPMVYVATNPDGVTISPAHYGICGQPTGQSVPPLTPIYAVGNDVYNLAIPGSLAPGETFMTSQNSGGSTYATGTLNPQKAKKRLPWITKLTLGRGMRIKNTAYGLYTIPTAPTPSPGVLDPKVNGPLIEVDPGPGLWYVTPANADGESPLEVLLQDPTKPDTTIIGSGLTVAGSSWYDNGDGAGIVEHKNALAINPAIVASVALNALDIASGDDKHGAAVRVDNTTIQIDAATNKLKSIGGGLTNYCTIHSGSVVALSASGVNVFIPWGAVNGTFGDLDPNLMGNASVPDKKITVHTTGVYEFIASGSIASTTPSGVNSIGTTCGFRKNGLTFLNPNFDSSFYDDGTGYLGVLSVVCPIQVALTAGDYVEFYVSTSQSGAAIHPPNWIYSGNGKIMVKQIA